MSSRSVKFDLQAIGALSILVRIALYGLFDYGKDFYTGDSTYYLNIGKNILLNGVHGENGVDSFFRPPLYSFFAGIVSSIYSNAMFFNIIQSVLYICFSFVVYFLLRSYSEKLAFWSALLIAISPFHALMNGRVLAENLVTPFIVLSSLFFIKGKEYLARYVVSGILLGAAILCRDVYMLLPLLFLILGVLKKINRRSLTAYVLCCLLMIGPWAFRNSQLTGGGVFLSKGIFWQNIWFGTWMQDWSNDRKPMVNNPGELPDNARRTYPNISPIIILDAIKNEDQEFFKKNTIHLIQKNPIKVISTWIKRYPLLWLGTRSDLNTTYLEARSAAWYFMKVMFYLYNLMLIVLAIPGLAIALRIRSELSLLCIPIFYNGIIYIPFYNIETRYTLPVMPLLIIFGVYFVLYLFDKRRIMSQ